MKIRYIELTEQLRIGGLEKAAADMALYLNEAGLDVFRGDGPVDAFGAVDLVHFHGLWSPAHFKMALHCRRKGIPMVVSPHGMLEPWAWQHRRWKKRPYFHLFEKRRLLWADALLATARAEAENMRIFFPNSRIEILTLGIEPEIRPAFSEARKELNWDEGEKVLLYLSRVHPKKGLKELLEALLAVTQAGPAAKLRLMILGDGPADYVETCRKLARQLASRMTVDWIPPQWGMEKWKYLQAADLFCLPTYSENFGIVILEAGMVGTPVFTTTGTPWKHIEEAGFGWVVDPLPERYREVLTEFINTPADILRAKREAFSRWTRDHYAWPNIVSQYKAFYENILKGES